MRWIDLEVGTRRSASSSRCGRHRRNVEIADCSKLSPKRLIDLLWIGLAVAFFHDLADKESEDLWFSGAV